MYDWTKKMFSFNLVHRVSLLPAPKSALGGGIRETLGMTLVFVLFEQRFQTTRKQTCLSITKKNFPKRHFPMCHVTKYSSILSPVFPLAALSRNFYVRSAILKVEKALGTRECVARIFVVL